LTAGAAVPSLLVVFLFGACEAMSQPRDPSKSRPSAPPAAPEATPLTTPVATEVAGLPSLQGPSFFAVGDETLAILTTRLVARDLVRGGERAHELPAPGRAIGLLADGGIAVAGNGYLCTLAPRSEALACGSGALAFAQLTHLWADAEPGVVWVLAGEKAQRWRGGGVRAELLGSVPMDRRARLLLAPLAGGGIAWSDGLYVYHPGGFWVAPRGVTHLAGAGAGHVWVALASGGLALVRLGDPSEIVRELAVGRVLSLAATPAAVAAAIEVSGRSSAVLVVFDDGGERLRVDLGREHHVGLAPTAPRVVAGGPGGFEVWDFATGKKL
jgi:hypothetical protein